MLGPDERIDARTALQLFDEITAINPSEEDKHQYSVTSAPKSVLVNLHSSK